MMKRLILLSWLLVTFMNSDLIAQSKTENKNSFYEAESLVLFEAYKDALPLYQSLLKIYPDNSNFKYRIGQCYLNIPGEKMKAISYLEDAVKNINPDYKEGRFAEKGVPYDALFYLANAYRINYQLDKALETYDSFKKNLNTEIYDTSVLSLQIQSCLTAKDLIREPIYMQSKNLGNFINSTNSEFNPVISDKEDLMVFSRSLAFYDAILYSTKSGDKWSDPLNMNELLKVDRDLYPTSLSKDGKELYLYSSADYDGIIYTSRFEYGTWSPLVKLNDNINTKYWESHAAISHDNKKLYFTSNRKGTLGGLDIYVSSRDTTGNWGPAVNLGPVINTPYNEESPFLSEDDKTLYFSSRGHVNMGGYDIFYSTLLDNGKWSVPLNIGYPLNTTDDDIFYNPLKEGYEGYIAIDDPEGLGKQDIYRIEIYTNDHPRKFYIIGMAKVADLMRNFNESVKISATNINSPGQTVIIYSNPLTGEYEFQLPQGNYQITYEGEGGETVVKNLDIPLTNKSDSFIFPWTILPKTDLVADLNVKSDKYLSVVTGDTILFPLIVEPKSLLTIEHWKGGTLLSLKQYDITDPSFNYKMVPLPGDNKVSFKLTDRFNNTSTTDVFITRQSEFTKQQLTQPQKALILSEKQINAYTALLSKYADGDILKLLKDSGIGKQQFRNIDELISYLKAEAARKGLNPEDIDKLALRVAVMDNILSQAAVDLMAKYTDGELKQILSSLNIHQANLKSWTDLQQYISEKTGGKVSPRDLNRIAASILGDIDPAVLTIREKILAFSGNSEVGTIVRTSVTAADLTNVKLKEKWLLAFCNESVKQGLTVNRLSEMLAITSALPGTGAEQYLSDLMEQSEEPLLSSLRSIDLQKEQIKSPKDLIRFLLTNKDKYPEEAVSKSIANLIVAKDIPAGIIASQLAAGIFKEGEKEIPQQTITHPEKTRFLTEKQITAYTDLLKRYADGQTLKLIKDSGVEKQQFSSIDDLISYLKAEASRKGLNPEDIDKLALRVAVMDNILSQAAVDLMAKYTDGELKQILSSLDISKANLKSWTDLQQYISEKTGGRISPRDLNRIAASILGDIDPSILTMREKISVFGTNKVVGPIVRKSIVTADLSNMKLREKWLLAFSNESVREGLTLHQLSQILAITSALPGTQAEQYLRDLMDQSEEPLLSSLKSIDLKNEEIKSPKDLIKFLLTNKEKYPEEAVAKSIANLIIAKDIPASVIAAQLATGILNTSDKVIAQQTPGRPEKAGLLADKQIAAYTDLLKKHASRDILELLNDPNIAKQHFRNADDLISWLKKEAAKKGLNPEDMDMLALRIAVTENILSQAAVDLMAKYSDGELKKILSELDIAQANLKTWTDLQRYISEKTGGRISPEDLNNIAAAILSGTDPSILLIREKILVLGDNSKTGTIVRQSVASVDLGNIKITEKWLMAFCNEAVREGLSLSQLSGMLAAISSLPDTQAEQFLRDLTEQSEEPLLSSLKSIDLKKEKIKSPEDLIRYLLTNKDKYPEEAVYKSIANLVVAKDIPADIIASYLTAGKENKLWILWIVCGAGAIFFFYFLIGRRKKNVK
jgi:hypothetical protein